MKATGIVRKIDALGRVVIPKELRDKMYIEDGDPLEIFVENDAIVIQKYAAVCVFCGSDKELEEFKGRCVCRACATALKGTN
jgi:transcriptional pleiotropic regulator of transition state genes